MTQELSPTLVKGKTEDALSFYRSIMSNDIHRMYGPVTIGENISISVCAGSKDEASELFEALAAGGEITLPLGNTFWGAYFGMLIDKFGIIWMVNSESTMIFHGRYLPTGYLLLFHPADLLVFLYCSRRRNDLHNQDCRSGLRS